MVAIASFAMSSAADAAARAAATASSAVFPPVDSHVWRAPASRRGPAAARPPNASPMPFSASVNSLGMIHILLDALSAIFGRVCRYW